MANLNAGNLLLASLLLFAVHLPAALLLEERKYSVKKTAFLWGLAGLVLFLDFYLCFNYLQKSLRVPVCLTIAYLYYLATFIYASADGFWKKCYLWVTYGCLFGISLSISLYLCKLIMPDITGTVLYFTRGMFNIVICYTVLLMYWRYGRLLIHEVSGFQTKGWRTLCVISVLYFFTFMILLIRINSDNEIKPNVLFLFLLIVCSFAAANILIISNIAHMRKEARDELVKQNVEYMVAYVDSARKQSQESRRIRHDMRHHDEHIASLAREGDTEGILSYLGQSKEKDEDYPVWCPNVTVNGILSSYAGKAKEAGVEYTAHADTPEQSGVADIDFVAILANLLENALNACVAMKSYGPVRIDVRNVGRKIVIAVSNPCGADLKLENGMPTARGIGIDSIISSSIRYQGEINYEIQEGICTACVILNA